MLQITWLKLSAWLEPMEQALTDFKTTKLHKIVNTAVAAGDFGAIMQAQKALKEAEKNSGESAIVVCA